MNWWKWGGIAALILVAFFLGRCNGVRSVLKNTGRDTVINYDTTKRSYIPVPFWVRYDSIVYVNGKPIRVTEYDTLWGQPETVLQPADTAAILKDYNATRVYSDTQRLKRGSLIIDDTLRRNQIAGRGVTITGTDTTIKETITLRPPKKFVGYFTLSGMGNTRQPFGGAGAGFGLKTPGDRIYQVEYKAITGGRDMIEARVFFPIRLFKKTVSLDTLKN